MWAAVDLAAVVARSIKQSQMALALAVAVVRERFSMPPKSRKPDSSTAVNVVLAASLLEAGIRARTVAVLL
jgi:hypothetical protein